MEATLDATTALPSGMDTRPVAARRAVTVLFFMNGALFATWVSRLPAMEAARGLSHSQLGVALLVIATGAVIAMPVTGMLSARVGTAVICRVSALVYCAVLPLLALAPGWLMWGLALFTFGGAHGALDVAMNAQAVAVEKRYPKPVMSAFHALFSTGGLAGAAAGGLLAAWPLRPEIHFALAAVVLGLLALTTFPHLLPDHPGKHHLPGAERTPRFRLPPRNLAALGVVALCIMMGEGAMADWTAVFLRKNAGTSEGLAAAGYAAFSIAMAAGRFTGDNLAARLGPVFLVRASALLAAAGMLTALTAPWPGLVLAGFAMVGAGFACIVPLVFSAAGQTPGLSPGAALAPVTTIGYLGFLLGPPVIGFAADWIGLRSALGLIAGASLLAAFLAGAVRRRTD